MSDQVMLAIIGGIVVIFGGAITTVGSVVIARMNSAARKVETVAKELAISDAEKGKQLSEIKATTEKIDGTTGKTLVHVNDAFLIQLRANRDMARTLAAISPIPEYIKQADAAEVLYAEHEAKQAEARKDKMTVELAKSAAVVIKEGVSSGIVTSVTAATKVELGKPPIA